MLPPPKTSTIDLRKVLVVDDQSDIREALRLLLKGAGYSIQMADSPSGAIAAAASSDYDLIVVDMNYANDTTSGQEGLDLVKRLRAQNRDVPIIAMTGWGTIELAVEAMQYGARDFITKPWDANHLLEVFEKHLRAAGQQHAGASGMDAEIAIARRVQKRLLPPSHFTSSGLDFDCAFLPAGQVGGDLYDFFEIEPGRVAFLLGDVCGKGMGAALLVANLQATIRSQRELAGAPSKLLEHVNREFFQSTRPEHFATLFFGLYEASSQTLRYVNCGHPPAILLRNDGSMEALDPSAIVLGIFENGVFQDVVVPFSPGDRLVLFSDGLSESKMDQDEENWVAELIQVLGRNASDRLAGVLAAAAMSSGPQADDITVIDIRST